MLGRFIERETTHSFRAAIRAVVREWRIMRAHRRGVRRASSVKLPCALHIGCGQNIKPGWVNVDLNDEADISLDAREALPFPNDSVRMIYSEHFFEHLSLAEGIRFLRECLRVLVPGGRLSLGVPNARFMMEDYARGDREKWVKLRDRYCYPKSCTTLMHIVNHFFRQGEEHKYAYDEETLLEVVRDCGFSNVHERFWDPALDLEDRRDGTLYIDGEKN
jgi:predicted SAM-dependent methyltransferase